MVVLLIIAGCPRTFLAAVGRWGASVTPDAIQSCCSHHNNLGHRSRRSAALADPDLPTVPLLAGQSCFFFYQISRVPLNHGNVPHFVRSRIFCCARAQFVTLPRCPDVIANHPIERNYGNSVRFPAKIPNGRGLPRPNRRATVYFGTRLISVGCILLLKKNLNMGPANRPAFCRQVPLFFYAKCPSKTFSRLAGLLTYSAS